VRAGCPWRVALEGHARASQAFELRGKRQEEGSAQSLTESKQQTKGRLGGTAESKGEIFVLDLKQMDKGSL
jgi:hypothetical protein